MTSGPEQIAIRFKDYGFSPGEYELFKILRNFLQEISSFKFSLYEDSGQLYIMPSIMRSDRNYLFQQSSKLKEILNDLGSDRASSTGMVTEDVAAKFRELLGKNTEWLLIGWAKFVSSISSASGSSPSTLFSYPHHIVQDDADIVAFLTQMKALVSLSLSFDPGMMADLDFYRKESNMNNLIGLKIGTFRKYFFDKLQYSVEFEIKLSSLIGKLLQVLEKKAPRASEFEVTPIADLASEQDFWSTMGSFFSARPDIIRGAALFKPSSRAQPFVQAQNQAEVIRKAEPKIKKLGETRLSQTRFDSSRKIEEFMNELVELARIFDGTDSKSLVVLGELFKRYELVKNLTILFDKNESDRFFIFKEITYEFTLNDLELLLGILNTIVNMVSNPESESFNDINKGINNAYDVKHNERLKESFKNFEPFGRVQGRFSVFGDHFLPFLANNIYHSKAKDKNVKLEYLLSKYPYLQGMIVKVR